MPASRWNCAHLFITASNTGYGFYVYIKTPKYCQIDPESQDRHFHQPGQPDGLQNY